MLNFLKNLWKELRTIRIADGPAVFLGIGILVIGALVTLSELDEIATLVFSFGTVGGLFVASGLAVTEADKLILSLRDTIADQQDEIITLQDDLDKCLLRGHE